MSFESLAATPQAGNWSVRLLTLLIAGAETSPLPWTGAPIEVRQLAGAVASQAFDLGLSRPSGRRYEVECALVLGPDVPVPALGPNTFELVRCEDGTGFAVSWDEEGTSKVSWADHQDGSTREEGSLDGFCRRLIFDTLLVFEEPDVERSVDSLYASETAYRALAGLLRKLDARRTELTIAAKKAVAAALAAIEEAEAAGRDSDAAYELLESASTTFDALGTRGPWPRANAV